MDPKLIEILKTLLAARTNARDAGATISPSDEDAFIRQMSKGKFSRKDLGPLLGTGAMNMASDLVRAGMNGATAHLADDAIGLFSPEQAEESRLRSEYFKQEHPKLSFTAELAGSLGLGKILDALLGGTEVHTVAESAKAGAKAGAGYGAAAGFGESNGEDFTDRLKSAATGGLVGGAAGGAVGTLFGAGVSAFSKKRPGLARLTKAIEDDGGLEAIKSNVEANVKAGRGEVITLADMGPHLRQALDFAANASDEVLIPAAQLLEARNAERAARLLADARANMGAPARLINPRPNMGGSAAALEGEPDAALRAGQLAQNSRAVGAKVYGDLEAQNPTFDIRTLPLDKGKIARLWQNARAAGNLTGKGPLDDLIARLTAANPTVPTSKLAQVAKQFSEGATERPVTFSDLQTLRQGLDGQTGAAFRSGNGAMGNALKDIQSHVDDVLEAGAPGFRAANTAYRGAKDLERALQSGSDWWQKADQRQLMRVVESLKAKPGALDEFRHGIASGLVEKLQAAATNRDVSREIIQGSQDMNAKLRVIFGDKSTFDAFLLRVKAEREMAKLAQTIGGSQTARRMAAQGYAPEELGVDLLAHGPMSMAKRAALAYGRATMRKGAADAMGPALLTQGADNIRGLLDAMHGNPEPLMGYKGAMLPAFGSTIGLMNLFGHE